MQTPFFITLAEVSGGGFWFPPDASASNQVDGLAYFILWICAFFLVFNAGLMVFFAVRYRQRKKEGSADGATHNTALEVTWSVIPAFILAIIFVWGFRNYLVMDTPPENAYDILVVGYRWGWQFHYEDGQQAKPWKRPGQKDPDPIALHVPANRPVRLTLQSNDVIHSVSIPQLRVKKDCVPGRYNQMWFQANWDEANAKTRMMATLSGEEVEIKYNVYDLFCTEYCGQDHSKMITKVYVYQQEDFDIWLAGNGLRGADEKLVDVGREVWASQCKSCHSISGAAGQGPAWNNVIGDPNHKVASGTLVADEEYIWKSITNPGDELVQGYQNVMPSFASLDPREIRGVIEFMKTLSPDYYPDEAAAGTTDATWGQYTPEGELIEGAGEGGEEGDPGDGV